MLQWIQLSLYKARKQLIRFEKFIAASSLLLLLCLAITQVLLRNIFEYGLANIDVITRHLVLFITFMGAALISESNQHIKIDCINAIIQTPIKQKLKTPLLLISSIICLLFFYYAVYFWLDEYTYSPKSEKLSLYLSSIIPLGFFTLSLHFILLTFTHHIKIERET